MPKKDEGTPRWVKVFGILALLLVALFVVLTFAGGGHGPSRHSPSADAAAPPAAVRNGQARPVGAQAQP